MHDLLGSRVAGFSGVSGEWLWEECGVVGCQENGEKKEENGAICSRAAGFSGVSGEWLWEECGVVGCQENGEKKEENGAICLGGKHCSLHSVLKSGTTGMV
nr:hypothetical protein [Tanacetum cinerariifolium]